MSTIPGVRVEDEGFFVCSAFSVAGSIATKAYLEVTAMADEPPPIIKVNLIKCCQFSGQLFYISPYIRLVQRTRLFQSTRWQFSPAKLPVSSNRKVEQ